MPPPRARCCAEAATSGRVWSVSLTAEKNALYARLCLRCAYLIPGGTRCPLPRSGQKRKWRWNRAVVAPRPDLSV